MLHRSSYRERKALMEQALFYFGEDKLNTFSAAVLLCARERERELSTPETHKNHKHNTPTNLTSDTSYHSIDTQTQHTRED